MIFLASAVGTVWETNFCLLILLVKKTQLLKSICVEIVMEDENCYCYRKSVSHLSGSFTSFWQTCHNMKTGFNWGLSPSYSLINLFLILDSEEKCFPRLWSMIFSTGYSAHPSKSKRVLLGLLQNLEKWHSTQERLNHRGSYRECRTIITALPRLTLFQVCQISSKQLLLGEVLSSLLRVLFCTVRTTVLGKKCCYPETDLNMFPDVWSVY